MRDLIKFVRIGLTLLWPFLFSLLLALLFLVFSTGLSLEKGWIALVKQISEHSYKIENLFEINIAIIGINLTIVAFVLQLAAQRYSAKIVNLFMQDRLNSGVFFGMVVSAVLSMLITESAGWNLFILPFFFTLAYIIIIVPYFRYVLIFLQPRSVIDIIHHNLQREISSLVRRKRIQEIQNLQNEISISIERIGDIANNSIKQTDRNIVIHAIASLKAILLHYLELKQSMPEDWFAFNQELLPTISKDFYEEISGEKLWFEMKVFLELEQLLKESLLEMNDVVSKIAGTVSSVGKWACDNKRKKLLEYHIYFFNTFLRHALNKRNVRATYIILYRYRQFSEYILSSQEDLFLKITQYYKYYAHLANNMEQAFVVVTVAHDLSQMLQHAADKNFSHIRQGLQYFLDLDQGSDSELKEIALRGVRKAQLRLAAHFLQKEKQELLTIIMDDLREESRERMYSILSELNQVREKNFWEISERRASFDYIPEEEMKYIRKIFSQIIPSS